MGDNDLLSLEKPQLHMVPSLRSVGSELDVLVYPDVGMEPLSYYLSFSRLAPIQMTWWGHPITTSSPAMDYFISLEEEIPEAHNHYTEQLVRMKWVNLPPMALEVGMCFITIGLDP